MIKKKELSCVDAVKEAIYKRVRKRSQIRLLPMNYKNNVDEKKDINENEIKFLKYYKDQLNG